MEDGFRLAAFSMPCGGHTATLNDLDYRMKQGFSPYGLSTMNAGIGKLPARVLAKLEGVLGCPLRVIFQHN
jgi:hypothetical protein